MKNLEMLRFVPDYVKTKKMREHEVCNEKVAVCNEICS